MNGLTLGTKYKTQFGNVSDTHGFRIEDAEVICINKTVGMPVRVLVETETTLGVAGIVADMENPSFIKEPDVVLYVTLALPKNEENRDKVLWQLGFPHMANGLPGAAKE